ncbi:MAG: phosphate ABC transporter permease subunit PstC [bacterium]|nr:phosphate ABC transporter permease subunit PstC [bacterium]
MSSLSETVLAGSGNTAQMKVRHIREKTLWLILMGCAGLSILVTAAIIFMLLKESLPFFAYVPLTDFFFGTEWAPLFEPAKFGVLPLIVGTLHITIGAALIAIPFGLASGIYMSEYASPRVRSFLKPVLEVLAGVPTIVYGYFALTFITPFVVKKLFPQAEVFNSASGAIVVGIMILPLIASLCDDAFRAVPASLRQAGFAMGATKFEVSLQIVLPAALSGVFAAFILALSRAIGETMAVTLAAGATPRLTANPLTSVQTLTAFIVQVAQGEAQHGEVAYQSIFAVALLLFVITLLMNFAAHKVLKRFREAYD